MTGVVTEFVTLRIGPSYTANSANSEPSSPRVLHLHPALIDLGLLQHVVSVRASGDVKVFPELKAVRRKLGHAPSKWFGRYKTKLGISDPRKTFHSFRHTLIEDLLDAGVQDSLIKRIAGHEDEAVTSSVYGSRNPLKAITDAICKILLRTTELD